MFLSVFGFRSEVNRKLIKWEIVGGKIVVTFWVIKLLKRMFRLIEMAYE